MLYLSNADIKALPLGDHNTVTARHNGRLFHSGYNFAWKLFLFARNFPKSVIYFGGYKCISITFGDIQNTSLKALGN